METPQPRQPNPASAMTQWWIAHPVVGFIGTIASVIGVPLAIYLYIASQATRDFIVTSDPPVAIVKSGQTGAVEVLYRGNKIMTDVYARQVFVWNAGTESIHAENVLEAIELTIPNGTILETRVRRLSRPLTKLVATPNGNDKVRLNWNILERNDGAALDIIYAAPNGGSIQAHGTIEHQGEVGVREYGRARNEELHGWQRTAGISFVSVLSLAFSLLGFFSVYALMTSSDTSWGRRAGAIPVIGFLFLMGGYGIWLVYNAVWINLVPPVV